MPLLSGFITKSRYRHALKHVRGDVLELGCGAGDLVGFHSQKLGRYVGVDISEGGIALAKKRFPTAEFITRDIESEELGFEEAFDSILMVAFIEHIFNQGFLLDQCFRALRPEGSLIITTPTSFGNDIVHRIGVSLGLFHKSAMDDHIVIYNKLRMQIAADEFGYVLAHYKKFQFGCNQLAVLRRPAL